MRKCEYARKVALSLKWDQVLAKLIRQTASKTKKQQAYIRKLRNLTAATRDKAIDEYYSDFKSKFLLTIRKLLHPTKPPELVPVPATIPVPVPVPVPAPAPALPPV